MFGASYTPIVLLNYDFYFVFAWLRKKENFGA